MALRVRRMTGHLVMAAVCAGARHPGGYGEPFCLAYHMV